MTKRLYDAKNIGSKIKERRKELGLTQKQLSEKSGVRIDAIKSYEIGRRVPEGDFREWIAKALNVYEDWLLGKTEDKNVHETLKRFVSSIEGIMGEDIGIFNAYSEFIKSLGYEIDYDSLIIKTESISRPVSNEVLSYLYQSTIKATRMLFDSIEDIEKELPPLPDSYVTIQSTEHLPSVKTDDLPENDLRRIAKKYHNKTKDNSKRKEV